VVGIPRTIVPNSREDPFLNLFIIKKDRLVGSVIESFLQYYGVDWAATILTFLAIYLLGEKKRSGFVFMIAGNVAWLVLGWLTQSAAMLLANLGFLALNWRGLNKWRPETGAGGKND